MEVPSSSIYKHLFEAQTQLANTLQSSKSKRSENTSSKKINWNANQNSNSKNSQTHTNLALGRSQIQPNTFNLKHSFNTISGDFLGNEKADFDKNLAKDGNRNKLFLTEYDQEDPKIERNYFEETDVDRVRELDDDLEKSVNLPPKSASGKTITERLSEKRLVKHSSALTKLDENLQKVKYQTENDLKTAMKKSTTSVKDKVIMAKGLLDPLQVEATEKVLYQRTFESLEDQWQAVKNIFEELKVDIKNVSDQIDSIEKSRSNHLTSVLLSARKELSAIAYLNDADVIRLIAELITALNKSLMENRVYFGDIIARLARHVVSEQLSSHIFYQKHLLIWRQQYVDFVVDRFKKFIYGEGSNFVVVKLEKSHFFVNFCSL